MKGKYLFLKKNPSSPRSYHNSLFLSRFPSPHYTPNVFCFFFFQFGKEKLIVVLLFPMQELGQQKVHHRLAKGLWCVVCLSLVSAAFGMSQGDKLGNKQVGEQIGQSAAW